MTSGKKTLESTSRAIQRLASYKNADGHWQWSYADIAAQIGCDERTVSSVVREGCRSWVHVSRWQACDPPNFRDCT